MITAFGHRGSVVYPCFDDQDFLKGYDSAQNIIELMHPDTEAEQECTSADDCHSATWASEANLLSYVASACAKDNCTNNGHAIWSEEQFFNKINAKVEQSVIQLLLKGHILLMATQMAVVCIHVLIAKQGATQRLT